MAQNTEDKSQKKDSKDYLIPLINSIEDKYYDRINVGFTIVDMIEIGFLVKTDGLFAFVEYDEMPWQYSSTEIWKLAFPHLQKKVFFGQVAQFQRDPLAIQINAKVPQFKKPELYVGDEYKGVIIQKSKFGTMVDIGYEFNWTRGSMIGLLPKKSNNPNDPHGDENLGQIVEVVLHDIRRNNKLNFRMRKTILGTGNPDTDNLRNKIVDVDKVLSEETGKDEYLVFGKYKAMMNFELYRPEDRPILQKDLDELPDKTVVHCEVTGYSKKMDQLIICWYPDFEDEVEPETETPKEVTD